MNLLDYCAELSKMLPKKYHHELCFVGGVLLNRKITDVDVFVYGYDVADIQLKLLNKEFSNGKELEVLDSLSTDDFYDLDKKILDDNNLTNYILSQGLIKNVSSYDFKRLTNEGIFLTKLAAFEQREDVTLKDLEDIKIIIKKFNNNIPSNLTSVLKKFDLINTYKRIRECVDRESYY
ncbi:MAG: hypothetical protein PHN56_02025 [Candidatus Nanoarchaeia archaeon]|nr:hypothetical protein [Candidatus Nanoarchaeia archaeon]